MTTSLISDLLGDMQSAGLRVWVESGRVCVQPKQKLTDNLTERIRAHRLELLDALAWDWWDCLEPEDYLRLTTPQRRPGRCAFCKGITRHSRECDELRASWQVMRWVKFKGRPLFEVPVDYLEFAVSRRFGTSDERVIFLDGLQRREPDKYRTAAWAAKVIDTE